MNGLIIYKGKYGATKQYAQWLSEELGIRAVTAQECTERDLEQADVVLLGSSVYIGKLQLSDFLKEKQESLLNKEIILFVVSATPPDQKEKWEEYVQRSVPAAIYGNCYRYFLPGRMTFKNLHWADKLKLKLGAWLSGSKKARNEMLTDFDRVDKANLAELIGDAGIFLAPLGEAV